MSPQARYVAARARLRAIGRRWRNEAVHLWGIAMANARGTLWGLLAWPAQLLADWLEARHQRAIDAAMEEGWRRARFGEEAADVTPHQPRKLLDVSVTSPWWVWALVAGLLTVGVVSVVMITI